MANRREMVEDRWSQRTRTLEQLEVGTSGAIQNQTGNNPTNWDKTVVIIESKPPSQVMVRDDGSSRVTMRNRRFVKPLDP